MDKARISKAIEETLKKGVKPFAVPPFINPDSYSAQSLTASHVVADQEAIDHLLSALREEGELALFDGGFILTGLGGFRSELRTLAEWLLAQSMTKSPNEVVDAIARYIEMEFAPAWEILAVAGVEVTKPVELVDGIRLVPFGQVPRSRVTDSLIGVPEFIPGGSMGISKLPVPGSALIVRRQQRPKVVPELPDPSENVTPHLQQATMLQICKALTLIGPSSPAPLAHWIHLDDWTPLANVGQGWGASVHEFFPSKSFDLTSSADDLVRTVKSYLDLPQDVRESLDVAIDRLNLSLRRESDVDSAIELRVALEALLAKDLDENAPVSYSIRIRGSYLASTKPDKRISAYENLNEVYKICSQAVHMGRFASKYEVNAREILSLGAEICAQLIRQVISVGRIPDWKRLVLGADQSEW